MTRLRDGSIASAWPRALVITHPDLTDLTLDPSLSEELEQLLLNREGVEPSSELAAALGEHLDSSDTETEDETRRELLATLDRKWMGWNPGFWASTAAQTERVEAMHARRRIYAQPRVSRHTLPASTVRRAVEVAKLNAARIYCVDDIDGLSILLAETAEVTLYEPERYRRAWIEAEAERAGVNARLRIVTTPPAGGEFDLTIAHAGSPFQTAQALSGALALTRAGGHLLFSTRFPWEEVLLSQLEEANLSVETYWRAVDHWILPNGSVIDGAGDLFLVERPPNAVVAPATEDLKEQFRAQPHLNVDIDDLVETRCHREEVERFVDRVATRSPHPEAMRSILSRGERLILCWYDEEGYGFSAELSPSERHIVLTLMPYSASMELALLSSAFESFADLYSRARPLRTRRSHEGLLFG